MITLEAVSPFEQAMQEAFDLLVKDSYHSLRKQAFERFQSLGWPNKNLDAFKGFPLKQLSQQSFQLQNSSVAAVDMQVESLCFSETQGQRLVFVDGQFQPELSDFQALQQAGVEVLDFQEAFLTFGQALKGHWNQKIQGEKDPFALLNLALFSKGCFVYVPQGLQLDKAVELLHIYTETSKGSSVFPKLVWMQGAESNMQLCIKDHYLVTDLAFCSNQSMEFILSEKAKLSWNHFRLKTPSEHWDLCCYRAYVKKEAEIYGVSLKEGAKGQREDFYVALEGENAVADLSGASLLKENRQSHSSVFMEHFAPYCESSQLFKVSVKDNSLSNFFGKIYVHPLAQKTQAYQLNSNLVLSDHAKALSKPHLEIFADDVKASHGSTVGKLCPQQLFYLKTRGLKTAEATALLIKGFYFQVLDKLRYLPAKAWAKEYFQQHLL